MLVSTELYDCQNCGEMVLGIEAPELQNVNDDGTMVACGECFKLKDVGVLAGLQSGVRQEDGRIRGRLTTFTLDAITMAPAQQHTKTPTVKTPGTCFDTNRSAVNLAVVVGDADEYDQ